MNTNDLVNKLVENLQPVKPMKPLHWFLFWIVIGVILLSAILGLVGIRVDLAEKSHSIWFSLEFFLLVILSGFAGWEAVKSGIPGKSNEKKEFLIPIILIGSWILGTLAQLASLFIHKGVLALTPDAHLACAVILLGMGLVAAVPLFIFLKKAAPLHPHLSGSLAGLASAALSTCCVQLFCLHDSPSHTIAWHIIPVLLAAPLGFAASKFFLTREWSKSMLFFVFNFVFSFISPSKS